VHEAVSGSTTEKIMIFRTAGVNHTFTVPAGGLNCDILMIGGGGGGGGGTGGGGAGACIVAKNQTLPTGSYTLYVAPSNGPYANGIDSYIFLEGTGHRYFAKGGGKGGPSNSSGLNGGCGGGAGYNSVTGTIESGGEAVVTNIITLNDGSIAAAGANAYNHTHLFAVLGNAGGNNTSVEGSGGGGGGIGTNGVAGGKGGDGRFNVTINGDTYNFRAYFANGGNDFGVLSGGNYYIGGGGGGYSGNAYQAGGLGGGGNYNGHGAEGVANTGSGGSGGGAGGSGIIIIRYRTVTLTTTYTHTPTLTTTATSTLLGNSAIELVRGTQGDSNTDYKLGNYGGDFKIISSISNTDTDRLNVTPAGNVGIGIASPQVKLHVTGEIYATGNITAYFSDERLKTKIANIHNPIEIIRRLNGFYYIPNDLAHFNGITNTDMEVGLSAQEVQRVLPEIVKIAPFDSVRNAEGIIVSKSGENYLTMSYERLIPVFVEAIKELKHKNIVLSKEIALIREKMKVICDKQKREMFK
jgi:hypothetical protein